MSVEKNAKQILNEHCQREKLPNPVYTSTPERPGDSFTGYTCTLNVCGRTFTTHTVEKTKKIAELAVAKTAVQELDVKEVKSEPKEKKEKRPSTENEDDNDAVKTKKEKAEKPTVKEPGWISIEKVEDIYKHLSEEVLAQEFKAFLHCKAQEEKKPYPVFTVTKVDEPLAGFTCVVEYDEKKYESLGLMNSSRQAEQSAAEACLRSLGQFPDVPKDQYTIQVWNGGKLASPPVYNKKSLEKNVA